LYISVINCRLAVSDFQSMSANVASSFGMQDHLQFSLLCTDCSCSTT